MTYLEKDSCYSIVMNRFREIASVRLPRNRFRRRHMSTKGRRSGIDLSIDPRPSALQTMSEDASIAAKLPCSTSHNCKCTGIILRHRSKVDSALRAKTASEPKEHMPWYYSKKHRSKILRSTTHNQ